MSQRTGVCRVVLAVDVRAQADARQLIARQYQATGRGFDAVTVRPVLPIQSALSACRMCLQYPFANVQGGEP